MENIFIKPSFFFFSLATRGEGELTSRVSLKEFQFIHEKMNSTTELASVPLLVPSFLAVRDSERSFSFTYVLAFISWRSVHYRWDCCKRKNRQTSRYLYSYILKLLGAENTLSQLRCVCFYHVVCSRSYLRCIFKSLCYARWTDKCLGILGSLESLNEREVSMKIEIYHFITNKFWS